MVQIVIPKEDGVAGVNDILRGKVTTDYYGGGITTMPPEGVYVYTYIGNASDTITGLSGDDVIIGDRYDTILQNFGYDYLYGGDGTDTIYMATGTEDPNWANPTEGSSGDNGRAEGGNGGDIIYGGGGDSGDYIYGQAGNDKLYGFGGNDYIYGGTGNDLIEGGNGPDGVLNGDEGNDTIRGGLGNDSIRGGIGKDLIYGDGGSDNIDGGGFGSLDPDEFDTLSYIELAGTNDYVNIDLLITGTQDTNSGGLDSIRDIEQLIGTNGGDRLYGADTNETIRGAKGVDTILGRGGVDKLYGGDGADIIRGGNGADKLFGDIGNDKLYGASGRDSLTGGAGIDKFYFFNAAGASNADRIEDFAHNVDKICLQKSVFVKIGGALSSAEIKVGAKATASNDYIVYNKAAGTLYYDVDGNGIKAAVVFAYVDANTALSYTDFSMVVA